MRYYNLLKKKAAILLSIVPGINLLYPILLLVLAQSRKVFSQANGQIRPFLHTKRKAVRGKIEQHPIC